VAALLGGAAVWVFAATRLWRTSVPAHLDLPRLSAHDYFTAPQLHDATSFERYLAIDALCAQIVLVAVLWLYARNWQRFAAESAAGRIGTGLLLGMLAFALVWIAQLPFGLAGLAWERSHGVSKEGYVDWAISSWLGLGARFLFICIAIAIVMALARPLRRLWWLAAAPVFVGLALLSAFLGPYLTPDLEPLHNRALRAEAARLARVEHVPGTEVSVEDVHEFTTAPNAEALGFGATERVVLWDTLVRKPFKPNEIRMVIAHELGHLQHKHILKGVALYALFAFPLAFAIALATRRRGGMYEAGAVPLAILVLTLLNIAVTPLQNAFWRRYEREADWSALQATHDPRSQRSVMVHLATTSLTRPDPPGFEQAFEDTHPTIMQRIELTYGWERRRAERAR
jgi:STE24 endopeptidase